MAFMTQGPGGRLATDPYSLGARAIFGLGAETPMERFQRREALRVAQQRAAVARREYAQAARIAVQQRAQAARIAARRATQERRLEALRRMREEQEARRMMQTTGAQARARHRVEEEMARRMVRTTGQVERTGFAHSAKLARMAETTDARLARQAAVRVAAAEARGAGYAPAPGGYQAPVLDESAMVYTPPGPVPEYYPPEPVPPVEAHQGYPPMPVREEVPYPPAPIESRRESGGYTIRPGEEPWEAQQAAEEQGGEEEGPQAAPQQTVEYAESEAEPEQSVDGTCCGGYIVEAPTPKQRDWQAKRAWAADLRTPPYKGLGQDEDFWYAPEWRFRRRVPTSGSPAAEQSYHKGSKWGQFEVTALRAAQRAADPFAGQALHPAIKAKGRARGRGHLPF